MNKEKILPNNPYKTPSTTNGPRINPFAAPTNFITSISSFLPQDFIRPACTRKAAYIFHHFVTASGHASVVAVSRCFSAFYLAAAQAVGSSSLANLSTIFASKLAPTMGFRPNGLFGFDQGAAWPSASKPAHEIRPGRERSLPCTATNAHHTPSSYGLVQYRQDRPACRESFLSFMAARACQFWQICQASPVRLACKLTILFRKGRG